MKKYFKNAKRSKILLQPIPELSEMKVGRPRHVYTFLYYYLTHTIKILLNVEKAKRSFFCTLILFVFAGIERTSTTTVK